MCCWWSMCQTNFTATATFFVRLLIHINLHVHVFICHMYVWLECVTKLSIDNTIFFSFKIVLYCVCARLICSPLLSRARSFGHRMHTFAMCVCVSLFLLRPICGCINLKVYCWINDNITRYLIIWCLLTTDGPLRFWANVAIATGICVCVLIYDAQTVIVAYTKRTCTD